MANQRIDNIAFYWNGSTGGNNSKDWVVYLAHTDKTAFTGAMVGCPMPISPRSLQALDLPETAGWVNIHCRLLLLQQHRQPPVCVDENTREQR